MVSRLKTAHRETLRLHLHLHTLQQTDNVGCGHIKSCDCHKFLIVPAGKGPHFLFRVLFVSFGHHFPF
jgi:hypothetical protein